MLWLYLVVPSFLITIFFLDLLLIFNTGRLQLPLQQLLGARRVEDKGSIEPRDDGDTNGQPREGQTAGTARVRHTAQQQPGGDVSNVERSKREIPLGRCC